MRWTLALALLASLLPAAGRVLGAESESAVDVASDLASTSSLAPASGQGVLQDSGRVAARLIRRNDESPQNAVVFVQASKGLGSPQTSPVSDPAVIDGSDRAPRSKALMSILLFIQHRR